MTLKILILGVNGISMQGIAKIMQELGHTVYGYDDNDEKLENITYVKTVDEAFYDDIDLIVHSSAIKEDHPLRMMGRAKNIKTLSRIDFFIQEMPMNANTILIAGAHGKTTTSSMLAYLLGSESYYLGGIINGEKSSAKFTKTANYTVIETDESDGSFLKWPTSKEEITAHRIILNFNYEHMVYFDSEENIQNAYIEFITKDLDRTITVINAETKEFLNIPDHRNLITYGLKNADFNVTDICAEAKGLSLKINEEVFQIPLFGVHNALNFAAIFALLKLLNEEEKIRNIGTFPGVKKRMQLIKYPNHDKKFFVDYGHHPYEINSVLKSIKQHWNEAFSVVLEPHKPSRILYTLSLWPEVLRGYRVYLYPLFIADEWKLNEEKLHFSTEKFADFLRQNGVDLVLLEDSEHLSRLDLNHNIICFSAGKLASILSKYS